VEPKNADVVYACNTNLYRSTDGGRTFAPIEGDDTGDDFHMLWIDPRIPTAGSSARTRHDRQPGRRPDLELLVQQPTAQLYHVSTDNRFPYWVYGPQQDAGAVGLPSRTNTVDGVTLEQFKEVTAGGESQNIAPDPLDPQTIYGGTVDKLDQRTEQTRSIDPTAPYPISGAARGRFRSRSRTAIRTCSIFRGRGSSAPRTAASIGRSSART